MRATAFLLRACDRQTDRQTETDRETRDLSAARLEADTVERRAPCNVMLLSGSVHAMREAGRWGGEVASPHSKAAQPARLPLRGGACVNVFVLLVDL